MIYSLTDHGIRIDVEVAYVPEDKRPPVKAAHFWAYQITITNERYDQVQLTHRHWDIVDGKGQLHIVDGEGVVGETPILGSGETFTYSSACPLETDSGTMGGHYVFEGEDGPFKAQIPTFSLHLAEAERRLN